LIALPFKKTAARQKLFSISTYFTGGGFNNEAQRVG
jgi:hypothetical protein